MAVHIPLSARLAEEAGFDAVWASGFDLSALYGLPDISLISMTQHLDMVCAMAGGCALPIVADIDTGFGNAVNVIHAIQAYERAGAAAVVIEDKTFSKVTSLVADGRQELVRREEFEGKIEAAVAAMTVERIKALRKVKMVIYGNHVIRACVMAMQGTFAQIQDDGGIHTVHPKLVSVEEMFRLQRMEEVRAAEAKFLR